jgi:hypothetical protein
MGERIDDWVKRRWDYDEKEYLADPTAYLNKLSKQMAELINNLRTDLILKGMQYAYYPETRVEPQ